MKEEMEGKAPAYQWYARDFASDEAVQLMSLEEEGAYRRLLDHQWLHESIPADVTAIARICKNTPPARMKRMWNAISPCFLAVEGDSSRLQNRRMERERAKSQEYREKQSAKGKAGARVRWGDNQNDSTGISTGITGGMAGAIPNDSSAVCSLLLTTTTSNGVVVGMTEINRLAAAANLGAAEHVKPARRQLIPRIIASTSPSRGAAEDLVAAGVPLDFAERAIYEIASTCEPDGAVKSLRYYVGAVVRLWEKKQAADDMQSVGDEGPKLNENGQKVYTSRYQSPAEIRELNEEELVRINASRVAAGVEPLTYAEAYRG